MEPTIDTREAGYAQIKAHELTTDHVVIDVYGGEHKVSRVRHNASGVRVERADGWVDHFGREQTVTVRP